MYVASIFDFVLSIKIMTDSFLKILILPFFSQFSKINNFKTTFIHDMATSSYDSFFAVFKSQKNLTLTFKSINFYIYLHVYRPRAV